MKTSLTLLLALLPAAAMPQYRSEVWCPDNGDGTYTNPVINADYSDPDVCADSTGTNFYLTASSFNCVPGLPILHSKDLVNWRIAGHALQELAPKSVFDQAAHGKGVWAPSIRLHNGEYYIYWGDPDRGIYMVKAKNPEGAWSEPLLVVGGKGMIDPTPLWDDDGRCYLVHAWAGSRAGFKSVLSVRELSPDGTRAIGRPAIVFDGNNANRTVEGPKFYKRGGWYWILAPAGGVATGWQLAMRSRSPWGPYECRTVMAQGGTAVNGPHQGALVTTAAGEDWFLHFQDKGPYGRVVHLQPVTWTDGWPVIGADADGDLCGEPVATHRKPRTDGAATVQNPVESDEFNSPVLGPQWQWPANYDSRFGQPTSLGFFRLYTNKRPTASPNLWDAPGMLLQKTPADAFTATAKATFAAKADGQCAGLIMMGADYSAIVVRRAGDKFQLLRTDCRRADKGGKETASLIAELEPSGRDEINYEPAIYREIYLRLTVRPDATLTFSYSTDGKNFTGAGPRSKMREGKWIGAKLGFVAQEPAGKAPAGFLDIDWIRITK